MLRILLRVLCDLVFLLRLAILALALSYGIFLTQYVGLDLSDNVYVKHLIMYREMLMAPIDKALLAVIPLSGNKQYIEWMNLFVLLLSYFVISRINSYLLDKLHAMDERAFELKYPEPATQTSTGHTMFLNLEQKLEHLHKLTNPKALEKAQAEYTNLSNLLHKTSRQFAFMALGIVNATEMKHGEDKILVQIDFMRFKKAIQDILNEHGCVQYAWAPHEVIASFNTLDQAFSCAQKIMLLPPRFNRGIKKINHDFALHCGLNVGAIFYDDTLRLDELSDSALDVAYQMQQSAPAGSIALDKSLLIFLKDSEGFEPSTQVINNMEVTVWGNEAVARQSDRGAK